MKHAAAAAIAIRTILAAAGSLLLAGAGAGQAAAQQDAFFAACMSKGNKTQSNCACQSKLARVNLNRAEQRAALSALRGDKDGFARQLRAMGQGKAKAFAGKMDRLGARTRAACR